MSSLDASQRNVETLKSGERKVRVPGELVYECTPLVTRVVEYGASADALLSGQVSPEPEGARIDFYLEGPVIGPKLTGTVKGVDYVQAPPHGNRPQVPRRPGLRADGNPLRILRVSPTEGSVTGLGPRPNLVPRRWPGTVPHSRRDHHRRRKEDRTLAADGIAIPGQGSSVIQLRDSLRTGRPSAS
jgi:hypothetical protein